MASHSIVSVTPQNSPLLDLTQNPASVFYLLPSDHANTKLVSTPFDGNGYCDWKHSIIIGLTTKNKMSFIDGTLPQPDSSNENLKPWERCHNMVLG